MHLKRIRTTYHKFITLVVALSLLQHIIPASLSGQDTQTGEGYDLRYELESGYTHPFSTSGIVSPLLMAPPSNIQQSVVYDPETNSYILSEKIGSLNYRSPSLMSFEEYQKYQANKAKTDYWQAKSREESGAGPSFLKGLRLGNQALDKVFGAEGISITPQGSAELIFGYSITTNRNPQIPIRNQRNGSFIFKEKIMMNVTGAIGDKMEVGLNYNTEASFDFENKTKLEYSGKEDEIIKKIEAGDVTFPLPGTLITGSQSLFGIRTDLQFGRLTVSTVFSNQRSESSSVNVQGGAQQTQFEIDIDDYDVNRHFFLSHYFRDNYNEWLKNPQNIESQIQIESIEVWVVNRQGNFEQSRSIVGVMDLAEGYGPDGEANFQAPSGVIGAENLLNQPADNSLNKLYADIASEPEIRNFSSINQAFNNINSKNSGLYNFFDGTDYVKIENARPLSSREYTVNRELGYISLNSPLRNNEQLAVAFVYTQKGKIKKVGELSSDVISPQTLIVKLLKGTTHSPNLANWDLMMKNIYAIGAYQVSNSDFILDVMYRNDKTGAAVNALNEPQSPIDSKILLSVTELDNLDSRNEPYPDGRFDFIEGVTVYARNGRIIFPLVEPFGSDLKEKIMGDYVDDETEKIRSRIAAKYVFQELYDSTQTKAQQIAEQNKFFLRGRYQSAGGSDIQLNAMNIPTGSVKVTAGGVVLTENVDYTVDYTLGRVKILNQGLMESGTPIKVSLESNSFFNLQQKTLMGTHLDYRFSENFNIGGTIMRLNERPLTEKVNYGEEPISNTIWGLNTSWRTESQLLTTIIDKLPFLETKETSSIAFDGEFAQLIPGQSKVIGDRAAAYIDDFEGAKTKIELKNTTSWVLASPPQDPGDIFYNASKDGIESGYGRGKLAWYIIDPLFYGTSSIKPDINKNDLEDHRQREVLTKELFPNKDEDIPGFPSRISVLNLNFYPNERGPYNFEPPKVVGDSLLDEPRERWGGMMREIITSDFEASNIEYIEFWLMDPYLEDDENQIRQGGNLYFHLGEVSEDILRDSRKSFENGYPNDETSNQEKTDLDETVWGYVPTGQSVVDAFDNTTESRTYQDIGLDGLPDSEEGAKHPVLQFLNDPSSDNFEYFLSGDHDAKGHNILQRYKNYNGLENNSPVSGDNSTYTPSNRATPDVEDIDGDNTLNTTETYYQYRISLDKNDFLVGENFIVDEVTHPTPNRKNDAKWYQFRVPISEFESRIGEISDFKSIRFIRMMVDGFDDEVALRFATLELVRGEWRRYTSDMQAASPSVNQQKQGTSFEVSAVNIEENGKKQPVNYVLPPGITRQTDPSQPQLRQLNEQSVLLKVENLQENDGRAIYKTTQLDLRQYEKLEMFIHAEALPDQSEELVDDDVTAIIRIGSDFQNNYYEYEIPLAVTPKGNYNSSDEYYQYKVWPDSNRLNLDISKLVNLKVARNKAAVDDPTISTQSVFIMYDGKNRIKVKGNPNLSNVRQIMLGVRNPGDDYEKIINDGYSKSTEVWFNELRLTGFNNEGGWAANGRVQAKLADLGIINVAGATSKPGFGSIEQKTEERQKEEVNQIDLSTNLELGKFFPEKAKVSIPVYAAYSNSTINPEYFPKDPDRKLKDVLAEAETKQERDSIKKVSQDKVERKSLNFTNVRWNKQFEKVKVLQPANFTASVLYTQTNSSNYSIDYNRKRKYGASLNYVYNNRPKSVTPFKKWKAVRKPSYRIIRDFNFNYLPSSFTFGTKFDRNFETMKIRNVYDDAPDFKIIPTTSRSFYWDRNYSLRWDFTRALKFDYTASNRAIIDEPRYDQFGEEYQHSDFFESNNQYWKDSVWNSISSWGRNLQFNQQFGLSYTLPLNKIPLLNWTNIKASYDANSSWTHGPVVYGEDENGASVKRELGHTLKNGNTMKLQGSFNMKNLYNKVGYFKQLDRKYSPRGKNSREKRYKEVEYSKRTFFKKDTPKNIYHKLSTEDITVKVTNAQGEEVKVNMEIISPNKITVEAPEDLTGATILVTGKIERGENPLVFIGENSIRMMLGIKNINVNYSVNSSTMLSGYLPETKMVGFDMNQYYGAPGASFLLGMQDPDINDRFSRNGWLTADTSFNTPTLMGVNETFNYRTTFEPFKGFRVDITGLRSHSRTTQQRYFNTKIGAETYTEIDDAYTGGNYSRSIISIGTAFEKVSSSNNWESAAFNTMKANRSIISQRLSEAYTAQDKASGSYQRNLQRAVEPGYGDGFSSSSSEVLIYSFLSAYTGANPNRINLNQHFSWLAMPNWKITFDGLSKLKPIQKFLKTLTVTHSYKSTYNIGQYATNSELYDYDFDDNQSTTFRRDLQGDFIPVYIINTVSINEQLSPLIGFDMTWHNSLLTRFEIKKSRLLSLSLNNQQLTESRNRDLVFSAGYKFKDVPLNLSTVGGSRQIKSDLNMRFDFTIRDNVTLLRSLNQTTSDKATTGARKFVLGYTADYILSQKVNLQFYIDWIKNTPFVSNYYPNSEFSFGFSLRLSL